MDGQVAVVAQHISLGQGLLGQGCLLLFILLGADIALQDLVQVCNDWLDFVAEKDLLGLIELKLNTKHLAEISENSRLVGNALQAAKLLLLTWKLVSKFDLCDLLHLLVELARTDRKRSGWNHSVKTSRDDWL